MFNRRRKGTRETVTLSARQLCEIGSCNRIATRQMTLTYGDDETERMLLCKRCANIMERKLYKQMDPGGIPYWILHNVTYPHHDDDWDDWDMPHILDG